MQIGPFWSGAGKNNDKRDLRLKRFGETALQVARLGSLVTITSIGAIWEQKRVCEIGHISFISGFMIALFKDKSRNVKEIGWNQWLRNVSFSVIGPQSTITICSPIQILQKPTCHPPSLPIFKVFFMWAHPHPFLSDPGRTGICY